MTNVEILKTGNEIISGNKLLSLYFMGVKKIEDLRVANLRLDLLERGELLSKCSREKALELLESFPEQISKLPYTISRVFLMENDPSEKFVNDNAKIISDIVGDFQKYAFVMHDIFDNPSFEAVKKLNERMIPEILVPAYCFLLIQKNKISDVVNYIEKFPVDNLDNVYWALSFDNMTIVRELIEKGIVGIAPLVNTYIRIIDVDQKFVLHQILKASEIEKFDVVISKYISIASKTEVISILDLEIDLTKCKYILNQLIIRNHDDEFFGELIESKFAKSKQSLEILEDLDFDNTLDKDINLLGRLLDKFLVDGRLDISICPKLQYHLLGGYIQGTQKEFDEITHKILSTENLISGAEYLNPINVFSLINFLSSNLKRIIRNPNDISDLRFADYTFCEKSGSKIVIQTREASKVVAIRIINSLPLTYNRPYKIWSILYNLEYPVAKILKADIGKVKEKFDIEVYDHKLGRYVDKSIEDFPYRVYSNFEGFNLSLIIKQLPREWRWDILKQQISFYNELRKLRIWHGHPHAQNWCVKFIHILNGKNQVLFDPSDAIKLKKAGDFVKPVAILIDFDKAVELGRSRYYVKLSVEKTLVRVRNYLGLLLEKLVLK